MEKWFLELSCPFSLWEILLMVPTAHNGCNKVNPHFTSYTAANKFVSSSTTEIVND
uniref:Uncharacterized protein n=1 Tax=Anguilla anguilla TaxID=7936 RepID=A0A0E9VA98_ANGAN